MKKSGWKFYQEIRIHFVVRQHIIIFIFITFWQNHDLLITSVIRSNNRNAENSLLETSILSTQPVKNLSVVTWEVLLSEKIIFDFSKEISSQKCINRGIPKSSFCHVPDFQQDSSQGS